MERASIKDLELGNLLFGHSRGNYHIDRDLYQERFVNMLEQAGYDNYGGEYSDEDLKEASIQPGQCHEFVVRPYWWGDDDDPRVHMPNFECHELGLTIKWYKYALRDSYSNIPFTEEIMSRLEEIAKER